MAIEGLITHGKREKDSRSCPGHGELRAPARSRHGVGGENGRLALTSARLVWLTSQGDRREDGGALGYLVQAMARWWGRCTPAELATAMASPLSTSASTMGKEGREWERVERQQRILHFRLARERHDGGRHSAWHPRGSNDLSYSAMKARKILNSSFESELLHQLKPPPKRPSSS
jgi:hypothetical protein